MKASFLLVLSAALSLGFIAPEKTMYSLRVESSRVDTPSVDTPDKEFAMKAADGGMAEVKLGELATKNGSSQKVKDFGRTMVTDHTKVNDELKATAKAKAITLPTKLSSEKQQNYNKLSGLKGEAFDKAYMDVMVTSHQETITLFQAEATNGKDAELKKWAEAKLPALKHHLEMAKMPH